MEIQKAEFITSLDDYIELTTPPLPEIAAAGRSNVGKSTLLNRVCNRKGLARASSSPGKTRLLNVYRINDALHWFDLPGYGFAKASKVEQARWSYRVESYFRRTNAVKMILHLVDVRHEPTEDDRMMSNFLKTVGIDHVTIATKSDKISRAQHMKQVHLISRTLQVQPWEIILFSGEDGTGVDKVRELMAKVVEP
ncbi:MAG: ribosome biogenesis GTP-binding protein YihA/YsxC [Oscillospiraceae bacterium]|nr:ribosome biogenesis GTP-binding protein YihA/YsxC [Oscillospiraceae bacterium]